MAAYDLFPPDRRGQWRGKRSHYNDGETPIDYCDKAGALLLKHRLEEYWRDRGQVVEIKLREAGFIPAMRAARVDVRSNMLNGMPRKDPTPAALPSYEGDE